jgi:hypothetical protein
MTAFVFNPAGALKTPGPIRRAGRIGRLAGDRETAGYVRVASDCCCRRPTRDRRAGWCALKFVETALRRTRS